jgi:hypothetical protein
MVVRLRPTTVFTRLRPVGLPALLLGFLGACGSSPAPANPPYSPPPAASAGSGGSGGNQAGQGALPPVAGGPSLPTAGGPSDSPDDPPVSAAKILPCDVSKIMVKSCQSCHGTKLVGGAPMPLVTFEDFHKQATTQPTKKVYQLVQERMRDTNSPMPPTNAESMSATDVDAVDMWIKGGALTGVAADAMCDTTKPMNPSDMEHTFGRITPGPNETCYDFKVHASQTEVDDNPFEIGPGEIYEQFYYNVPWPAGSVATAYATIADNAQVLHHWLLFSTNELQTHGAHVYAPLPTLFGTDPVLLAGWAVGGPNLKAPEKVGFELPDPGARTINVQWHFYNSTPLPQSDKSTVQICTVPKEMKEHVGGVTWLGTEDLNGNVWTGGEGMPPNQESTFKTTCFPGRFNVGAAESIHIIGFEPHMHRIGKRMQTSVRHMDGMLESIFDKPFVFGSETHYYVDYELKPGETLETSCSFLNDTNKGVPFGESTDTEMCYQFTFAYPAHAISNGAFSLLGVTDTCW